MIDRQSFVLAKDNMDYDAALFKKQEPFVRLYTWQSPGLTYAYRQTLPHDLQTIDNSVRITGGGIVFHCPGDLVFSIALMLDGSFKACLQRIQAAVLKPLLLCQPHIQDTHASSGDINRAYCAGYHSPYELSVDHHKVFGIAAKKNKRHICVQGILHVTPSNRYFGSLGDPYTSYFTQGMACDCVDTLTLALGQALEALGS